MLFQNRFLYHFAIVLSFLCFVGFIYISYVSFFVVQNQFISVDGETYVNQVRTDKFTKRLSNHITKNCSSQLCEVQSMLDYVTHIPYKENPSVARSAKNVIKNNYGDCDDKSNLLISLLNAQGYEAYFVLVPKHIYVIVNLNRTLPNKKAIYVNGKPFYKLESTAKGSPVGFPIGKHKLEQTRAIIDPFENRKIEIVSLEYRY